MKPQVEWPEDLNICNLSDVDLKRQAVNVQPGTSENLVNHRELMIKVEYHLVYRGARENRCFSEHMDFDTEVFEDFPATTSTRLKVSCIPVRILTTWPPTFIIHKN